MNRSPHWYWKETEREEGGDRKEGKRRTRKGKAWFVFLAEGDRAALVLFSLPPLPSPLQLNLELGTCSPTQSLSSHLPTNVCATDGERRRWPGDQRPPEAFCTISPAAEAAGDNSMWARLHVFKDGAVVLVWMTLICSMACFFCPFLSHSQWMQRLNIYDGRSYWEKPSWEGEWLVIFF